MVHPIERTTMSQERDISVPNDPARRRLWIIAELQLAGTSLAAIARDLGRTPQAGSNALKAPSLSFEQEIARRLGVPVQKLFPDRYKPDGTRICRERPAREAA